jgi:RNA polymerase sigma-70 factor (ECF subfamily)
VLLETLSPDERAVFVLREVFGFDYDEIASAVGKFESAVRQVAHRARKHVQARRKRFEPVDLQRHAEITAQFFVAASTGDVQTLMKMLAPDATWITDSGGKVVAALRPVVGAAKVAAMIAGLVRKGPPDTRVEMATCNSAPAVLIDSGDHLDLITVDIVEDKITTIYAIRNPDKLAAVATARQISR